MRSLPAVATFSREEFLTRRFAYAPGEHVSFLGPTRCGKTTLAFQLLERVTDPRLQGVVLVMKPRDAVVTAWTKRLNYRRTGTWPPLPSPGRPPNGYTLWPKPSHDFERDDERMRTEFQRAIRGTYRSRRKFVLFADEVWGLDNELKLGRDLIRVWSRGASMDCGLWGATQRPSDVPLWMYSMAHHLFLAYEPDKRGRDRFAEIGGVDPDLVKHTVMRLQKFQLLYIRREGPALCVIDP